jgi:hypothetical protein
MSSAIRKTSLWLVGTCVVLVACSTLVASALAAEAAFYECAKVKRIEGGPEVTLHTEVSSPGGEWGIPSETGWSAEFTGKGEYLELKA